MSSDSLDRRPVETLAELAIKRATYAQLLEQAVPSTRELIQQAIDHVDAEIEARFHNVSNAVLRPQ